MKEKKSLRQIKQAKGMQEAQLLTILVEFNDDATTTSRTRWSRRPSSRAGLRAGHRPERAAAQPPRGSDELHPRDNNTMWVPDFSPEHFDTLLYTHEGITDASGPT